MKLFSFLFRHIIPIGLVVGAGFVIYGAATPTPASRIEGIGIDLFSSPPITIEAVESQLNSIQRSGSEYVRIEMSWTLIETSQDTYDWSNVVPLDLFFSSAQSRGLKSVAVITGLPIYLSSAGTNMDEEVVGECWEKFIQAAVDHFGDQIDYWQLGDQLNSTNNVGSFAQSDPTFYSKMLRSASKIIKKADANDKVWMGSLVSATAGNCALNPLTYLLEVNGARGWNSMDAITFQPERGAVSPENSSTTVVNQSCNSSLPGSSTSLAAEVTALQDLARQLGGKPVYITGLSWSQEEVVSLQENRIIDMGTLQSDLLVRASVMMMGGNSIPLIFWQINPLSETISMTSLANLTTTLNNSKSLGQIQGQTGNVQEYRFQKSADLHLFAWRTVEGDSAQPVVFSTLPTKKMTAFSADSASLTTSSGTPLEVDDTGSTIIMLNERPVILTGKSGGLDDQIRAVVTDQLDIWRIGIQNSISGKLNDLKSAFLQMLGDAFNQAKEDAIDWGKEQINDLFN